MYIPVYQYTGISVYAYTSIPVYRYTLLKLIIKLLTLKSLLYRGLIKFQLNLDNEKTFLLSIPVYQYTGIPVYQYISICVYQYTSICIYQYTSIPVYDLLNVLKTLLYQGSSSLILYN